MKRYRLANRKSGDQIKILSMVITSWHLTSARLRYAFRMGKQKVKLHNVNVNLNSPIMRT